MRSDDDRSGNLPTISVTGDLIDPADQDEEERPDNALDCPLLDTPIHFDDCTVCHGRGWVVSANIDAYVGGDEVPCITCGGEGATESGGPVTWTCTTCLGTGLMPVSLLAQFDLTKESFYDQDWRDADMSGQNLSGATFEHCDFSGAIFDGADLTNTTFEDCQFAGVIPAAASSLEGTRFEVTGLSAEQRAACAARGAVVVDLDDEEDE